MQHWNSAIYITIRSSRMEVVLRNLRTSFIENLFTTDFHHAYLPLKYVCIAVYAYEYTVYTYICISKYTVIDLFSFAY